MNIKIEEDDAMVLWDKHFKTNPAATKKVNKGGGRSITAIDAYHQIKEATEEWGPMGRWGIRDIEMHTEGDLLFITGEFFYPGGSFAIFNSASMYMGRGEKRRIDDEVGKKIVTDALTKALSYLGFNADVFFGLFDSNKYVEDRKKEEATSVAKELETIRAEAQIALEQKEHEKIIDKDKYDIMANRLNGITDVNELQRALTIIQGFHGEESDKNS